MNQDEAKRVAAEAALAYVPKRGALGLGTGSTVRAFITGVGELVRQGYVLTCVATSEESRKLAEQCGIPLASDTGPFELDLCVDGADEVSAELDLIKGGGGAHAREKIVNFASRQNIIVVDGSKLSQKLGEKRNVPVEVLRFGHLTTRTWLAKFGAATLRLGSSAEPFQTDSGNYIYDVACGPIADPARLDRELKAIVGVVETGLFCGRADIVIAATPSEIRKFERSPA